MKKKYLLIFFGFLSLLVRAQVVNDATAIQVIASTPADICNPRESVTLSCTYDQSQVRQTTGYAVSLISFGTVVPGPGTITTDLTTDDDWSPIIDLKGAYAQDFNFCFYGNSYSKCLVNTNGVISFSINGVVPGGMYTPGANCGYLMSGAIPHTPTDVQDIPYANAIHGVCQDIFLEISNSFARPKISYFTIGTYPNRKFVLNISEVAQYGFSCRNDPAVGAQSSQIVLYESTNIIDVNVMRRVPCPSWENGDGVLGIQNSDGTIGAFPPGRNRGAWSASNESWRFTPTGNIVNPVIQWKDNLGNIVGNGQTITVAPNATTTYTVTATYPTCDPAKFQQVSDQATVNLIGIATVSPGNLYACNPGATSYIWDLASKGTAILGSLSPIRYDLSYHTTLASAEGAYTDLITGSTTNYITSGGTTTIWVRVEDSQKGCVKVVSFDLVVNCAGTPVQPGNWLKCDNDGNTTELFNLTQKNAEILGTQNQAADYIITYHTTLASADGTSLNSALIPAGTAVGDDQNFESSGQTIYVRMESVSSPGVFATISFQLVVNPRPAIDGTRSTCVGSTTQLTGAGSPDPSNPWSSSDTSIATVNSSGIVTGVAAGTAIITYTNNNGCFNTANVTINPPSTPTFTQPAPICSGGTLAALPTTSNEGITGTWSPALNNTATTVYTFTPSAGQCAIAVPMTITVNQLPTVTVNNAGICTGDTATITATPGTPGGSYTYTWTVPGTFPNPGNVPSFTTTTLGTYTVVITDNTTNCSSASASGNVTSNSTGGNFNLFCDGYNNDPAHPNAIHLDWSNVPGITSFNYSYSIAGGPVVTGSIISPTNIYIVTNGQPITFTISGVGSACVAPQTVTCGCPSPIINAVPNVSACSGQSVNQVDFATSDAYDTVSWTNSNPAIGLAASGTSNFIPSFTAATVTTPQTATITVVLTKYGCTGPSRTFTITVYPLPTVTVNDQVTCSGTNTTVTAIPGTAATYNYAWTVPAGFPDPGNVPSFQTSTAGTYSVVITNSVTGCVSASDSGTVTVNPLPTASIAIAGASTICSGTATSITVSGTPNATVNYTINNTPASVTLPASGSVTFATGNLSAQTTYQLTNVSVGSGCTATLSQQVVVNIAPQPTASISGATSICFNSSANITFNGTAGATVGYTVNSGAIQTVILGAGGTATVNTGNLTADATYTLVNVTAGTVPNCVQTLSGSVTVTVVQTPTVADPGPQTICSGQSTGIRLLGTVPNTTFTWTYTQTGGVTGASNSSGNIISQVLTAGTTAGTVTYTITPAVGSCIGTPITVTVTVNPVPVVNVINAAPYICTGGSTNITMSSTIPSATFSWNVTQTGSVTGATSGTGSSINQTLTAFGTTVGQAVYTIIPINNGCQGAPKTVTVTVYPRPKITASPSTAILCSGEKTNIVLGTNVPNTVYTWSVLPNGVLGALPGTGSTISQTLFAAGSTAGTVIYTITPTVNGCTGDPITATVTVNPRPEIFSDANPPAICSGDPSGIIVNPSIAGTSIFWTVVENGVTGASDGSGSETTPGAGIPISQILTTTGNVQGTVVYTITPMYNGCAGVSRTVTVRVNPTPKINIPDGLICIDAKTGALMYGYTMDTGLSEADYDFQWYFEDDMNNVKAMTSSYVATEAGTYTVSIMNALTGCTDVFLIKVEASVPATAATAVVTNYFEDTQAITVTVAGTGSYLYSLDGGAFQTSNVFINVLPGEHTVTIHDAVGCTDITLEHIITIGYPRFFTPNGDGYNDTWNIWSLSNDQPNAEIHIFDRYGKLIKQIVPGGNGWDGLFNGQTLPSTDYWFTVKYKENGAEKLFKAHFSMKR